MELPSARQKISNDCPPTPKLRNQIYLLYDLLRVTNARWTSHSMGAHYNRALAEIKRNSKPLIYCIGE